jgi:hypothetical protein
MIGRLLGAAIGVVWSLALLAGGGAAAEWYERRPAGQPAWARLDVLWLHWRLPDGLAARAAADRAAFAAATAALRSTRGALGRQNAAVLALQRAAVDQQAQGQAALGAASAAFRQQAEAARDILAEKPPADADELALCRAADRLLVEAAQ